MRKVDSNGSTDQTALAALAEQAQALLELTADLKRQVDAVERAQAQARACTNGLHLRRCSPDEMLDEWQAARGTRAEAHLLSRIYRRRAARRVAL